MSKNIKGITIEFDGDTSGLTQALKKVDGETKKVQTELKQVDRLLKFDPSNTELLAQKQKLLGDAVQSTEKRLDALKQAQSEVERQFKNGEIGEEAFRKFQREIIATEGQLKAFKGQIKGIDAKLEVQADTSKLDKVKSELKDVAETAKDVGKKVGDGLKKGFEVGAKAAAGVGVAAAGAAVGVGAFVESQKEMSMDLARLRTNAESAGFSLDKIEDGFKKVAAVSGETDSAIETMSNLMATDFSENQLAEALDYINGAAIKFSDTLKTEGIADGLQETFATGKAIGPFSELLERSGVDLEKFDEGLAKAAKNGKQTDYVLQQLSQLGLASVYEEYKKNNQALLDYNEAQMDSQLKLEALANKLRPFVTMMMEFGNIILDVILGNKSFAEGLNELIPRIKSMADNLLTVIKKALPGFINGFNEMLPQMIQIGTDIFIKIADGLVKGVPILLDTLYVANNKLLDTITENLPRFIDIGVNIINSLINGLMALLPKLQEMGMGLLTKLFQGIMSNLPQIISAAFNIVTTLISGLIRALPKMTMYMVTDFLPAIIKSIIGADWIGIGKSIIQGLIDGIKSMGKALISSVGGVIKGAIDGAKNLLKINSPSKVFFEMGEFTNEGYIDGIQKSSKALFSAVDNVYGSIASSAQKSISGTTATTGNSTTSIDNSRNLTPTFNIYTTESPEKALNRELRKMAFQF